VSATQTEFPDPTATDEQLLVDSAGAAPDRWASYVARYRNRDSRPRVFHDMICDDARSISGSRVFLDIGCGRGFLLDVDLQQSLARQCDRYVGIEPDTAVQVGEHIDDVHRCTFAEAELDPCSINMAFALMVLEHIADPRAFFKKLHAVLAPGGVFWGITVDARHYFCTVSKWAERLRIKGVYLTLLKGRRGEDRWENYPTHYRANSPAEIRKHTEGLFRHCDFISFSRVGELNCYLPRWIRPLGRRIESRRIAKNRPGSTLAVRLQK